MFNHFICLTRFASFIRWILNTTKIQQSMSIALKSPKSSKTHDIQAKKHQHQP